MNKSNKIYYILIRSIAIVLIDYFVVESAIMQYSKFECDSNNIEMRYAPFYSSLLLVNSKTKLPLLLPLT